MHITVPIVLYFKNIKKRYNDKNTFQFNFKILSNSCPSFSPRNIFFIIYDI